MNPTPRELPQTSDERPFYSFQSVHSSGVQFLFGDGSAKLLNESMNQGVFEALSTIAGREFVSDGDY